ncbi:MAG: hypothetical protein PHV74_13560 [Dehalococcoidia bacterium]|nr:hypothetical protein [Dehalococcoidia bacterium]
MKPGRESPQPDTQKYIRVWRQKQLYALVDLSTKQSALEEMYVDIMEKKGRKCATVSGDGEMRSLL